MSLSACRTLASKRLAPLEVLALWLGNVVGVSGQAALPIWVAAITKNGSLTRTQLGWLGSGELFFVAIGAFAVSLFGGRASPRRLVAAAACAIVISNLIATLSPVQALVIGRLLSGAGMGVMLASALRVIARRSNAQRVFAGAQLAILLFSSALFFTSATLIGRYGPSSIFVVIAVMALLELVVASFGLPYEPATSVRVDGPSHWLSVAPLLCLLGVLSLVCSFETVWAYVVVIGNTLGFSAPLIGNVIGTAIPAALLAPIAAGILGERLGLAIPLFLGSVLIILTVLLIVSANSPFLFGICAAGLVWGATFYVPYAFTLLARLDQRGNFVSALPMFTLVGAAAGPTLGARFVSYSLEALAVGAASLVAAGMCCFAAAFLMRSPQPTVS